MKQNRVWLLIIAAILLLSVAAVILIQLMQQNGDIVEIYQDGDLIYTLPLDEDQSVRIEAEQGGYNVVTILQGQVWVSESSCPDQVCVHHGPTCETADPIVCLPNKLVVRVVHAEEGPLDRVTG